MSRSLVGVSLLAICGVGFAAACGDDDGQTLATTTGNGGNAGGSTATVGGSGGDGGVQMAGGGGSTSTSSGGAPSDYPDGGYGNQEGDVFPFLTWQGYLQHRSDRARHHRDVDRHLHLARSAWERRAVRPHPHHALRVKRLS